jgi:PAS domain S-box-containing protein
MSEMDGEEKRLRSVALQNAQSILFARQRAEQELLEAKAALQKHSEWLRITLSSIGDAVIATDAEGRVAFMNGVAEALTGWAQAEANGRPLSAVFHIVNEQTRLLVENPALRALQEGAIVGLANHTVLIARNGTERAIEDSAAPMTDDNGNAVGAVLVFRDVTERRRADEALREREQWALDILESVTDAFFALNRDWRFTYLNRHAGGLLGLEPGDLLGKVLWEAYPGLPGSDFEQAYRKAMEEGVASSMTSYYADHDRWYEVHTYPSPEGIAVYFRNVTERMAAERAIRESEERYRRAAAEASQAAEANAKFRAFFEQGTNFAGVLSLDGTLVEANRLCLDACGFSRDEVIGRPFWECGWWNRSPALVEMVRAASLRAAKGQLFRAETMYFVADGAERVVDLIIAPVMDNEGRVLFMAATGIDITDRKQMEDVLRESDRKKDDFIALLAHELRNPLAPVRNGLQVMRLAGADANAVAQTRAMMDRQLSHMVRLIDDLLDVSRISRNKMELRRERVLLAEVVNTAVETARPQIDAEGHDLTVSLPQRPVYLNADLTRLAQVFGNLLTNSAKYTEPGGRIWISAERREGEAAVSVRDTGIGIPAESLPIIFDMFSQVDRTTERSTGGLGIGLALVKGLVEMHGGTVTAQSGGQGQGSIFTVMLPILMDQRELAPTESDDRQAAVGPRRRILVVDDNRDGADSLAMLLELMNNEVQTASDGEEAVETAERFLPEVILMDVGMPRLNGLDATRRIREQPWGRSVKIIALTGWGQEGDKDRSRDAGCDGHLVKPVSMPDLEALLAEAPAIAPI